MGLVTLPVAPHTTCRVRCRRVVMWYAHVHFVHHNLRVRTVLNATETKVNKQVSDILDEGCNVLVDKKLIKDVPEWLDEELFARGQKHFYRNLYSIFISQLIGLILVLSVPSLLDPLTLIKKNSDPYNAFRRYVDTFKNILRWYKFDLKNFRSKSQESVTIIYSLHCVASQSYDKSGLGLRVTQKDMALIQFGLVGLTLLRKKELAIIGTEDDDRAIVHFWRIMGYMLGINDKYNLCKGTLEEVRSTCAVIFKEIYVPALSKPPSEYNHMVDALVDGMKPISPMLDLDGFLSFAFELCGISDTVSQRITTRHSRWIFNMHMYIHNVLLSNQWLAFIFRPLLNYTLMISLWMNSRFPFSILLRFGVKVFSMF